MMAEPEHLPPADDRIDEAAAEWLARRDAGLDAAGTRQLLEWLAADPRHAAAFHEVEVVWRIFDVPRAKGQAPGMVQSLIARQNRHRRRVAIAAASTLAAAAAVWLVVSLPASWHPSATFAAAGDAAVVVLRPEHRVLDDGSVVEFNGGTKIEVQYSAAERDIRLLQGDAHFTVAKNPARPFVVTTPKTAVRAVGTVFAVSVDAHATDVIVTEGRVAVGPEGAKTPTRALLVPAGNRLLVPARAESVAGLTVAPITNDEIARRLGWRVPRLELSATPLSDVAAAFNRENRLQLSIADPALRDLRLTGVFALRQVEEFVRLLEANYGIRATRRGDAEIALSRR